MVANNLSHTLGFKQLVTRACFERQFNLRRLTTVTPLDLSPKNKQQQKSTATHINNRTNQENHKSTETEINTATARNGGPQGVIKTLLGLTETLLGATKGTAKAVLC
jgi:hypothetical protein